MCHSGFSIHRRGGRIEDAEAASASGASNSWGSEKSKAGHRSNQHSNPYTTNGSWYRPAAPEADPPNTTPGRFEGSPAVPVAVPWVAFGLEFSDLVSPHVPGRPHQEVPGRTSSFRLRASTSLGYSESVVGLSSYVLSHLAMIRCAG